MAKKKLEEYDAIEDDGEKKAPERHNEYGEEVLDPVPLQPPLGYKRSPTLSEQILQQVRHAKLEEAANVLETDEDADDFNVGDDYEPLSKYENDHIPSVKELKRHAQALNEELKNALRREAVEAHKNSIKKPAPDLTPEKPDAAAEAET